MSDKSKSSPAGTIQPKVVIERTYRAQAAELWDLWTTKARARLLGARRPASLLRWPPSETFQKTTTSKPGILPKLRRSRVATR